MENKELAAYLARQIFEIGDEPNDKAQRLEFKGGTYPDHETNLGGLSESSLADFIHYALDKHSPVSAEPNGKGDL